MPWLQRVREEVGLPVTIEVATPRHVEEALRHGIDVLWIGARTTVNPFAVQELADALAGTGVPVMVKNPVNPDVALWAGALERLERVGITDLAAIHRGFSTFAPSRYRNAPTWQLAFELKARFPHVPLICDPSHISGRRDLILPVSQKALDLDYDGLMIETHPDPDHAFRDAAQQVTPATTRRNSDGAEVPLPLLQQRRLSEQSRRAAPANGHGRPRNRGGPGLRVWRW